MPVSKPFTPPDSRGATYVAPLRPAGAASRGNPRMDIVTTADARYACIHPSAPAAAPALGSSGRSGSCGVAAPGLGSARLLVPCNTSFRRIARTLTGSSRVWLYAYAVGVRSSRELAQALVESVAFRVLAANQQPRHWALNRFRARHEEALGNLPGQSVAMAAELGLVELVQSAGHRAPGSPRAEGDRSTAVAETWSDSCGLPWLCLASPSESTSTAARGCLAGDIQVAVRSESVVSPLCQLPRYCPIWADLSQPLPEGQMPAVPTHTHSANLDCLSRETPSSMAFSG